MYGLIVLFLIQRILQELSWELKWLISEAEYSISIIIGAYCSISDTENSTRIVVGG